MSDDDIRRDEATQEPEKKIAIQQDAYANMLRDLPRMRTIEPDDQDKEKVYLPPPPTASRIGGLMHGCGSLFLTLLSIPMVLVAIWFGYYIWGPGLFFVGGLVLLFATRGIWGGRRTALVISLVVLPALGVVGYMWQSFIPAAGALSPLGPLALMYDPAIKMAGFVLVIAFVIHLITLVYWKRLQPLVTRGLVVWGAASVFLIVVVFVFNTVEMQRRETWLDDTLDEWSGEAQTDSLALGGSLNVTLGYSFLTLSDDDDPRFDVRSAELQAHLDSGADLIRIGASGDMWWEQEQHRLFADEDEEDLADAAERIGIQQEFEAAFMDRVSDSGVDVYFSDAQYSPYLIVWANDEDEDEEITWDIFADLHAERIRRYAREYQPAYYEIVNEPNSYAQYSGVDEPEDDERLEAWVAHTEDLIAIVEEESPDTQIGVTIGMQEDFDLDYYERVLDLDGIDFVSFRLFQPAAFDVLEDVFEEHGNPADYDKAIWVAETWYGYCLAPQRNMDHDSEWLAVAVVFAAKENLAGVLASDFGCFLQEGGTLASQDVELDGRTEVWAAWQALVDTWSP